MRRQLLLTAAAFGIMLVSTAAAEAQNPQPYLSVSAGYSPNSPPIPPTSQPRGKYSTPLGNGLQWRISCDWGTFAQNGDWIPWAGGGFVLTPLPNAGQGGYLMDWSQAGTTALAGAPNKLYVRALFQSRPTAPLQPFVTQIVVYASCP